MREQERSAKPRHLGKDTGSEILTPPDFQGKGQKVHRHYCPSEMAREKASASADVDCAGEGFAIPLDT
jgi:hypothetical protein